MVIDIAHQLNVYEYLGKASDPLYIAIGMLQGEESLFVSEIKATVQVNQHGLYEMITKSNHECYSNIEDLYDCVSELLSNNL
ncbi:hypothetical protein E4U82_08735 [Lentibacillus salicampi]|uniref:Uncharacterized protein n=1 Tax=Lentibacillus salicampi TaxID=175306 RepID=A0A4Y9ACW8_9BACI|nr:hypothetical protein E4U82_08735 [Lentibacillus salicampi]